MPTCRNSTGRILVVTDNDKAKADALATAIGEEFVAMRGKTAPEYSRSRTASPPRSASNDSPVVMADPADNAGGGAPTDNTTILRRLIERDAQDAALGPIWDPIAVRLCFDAGLGASFPLRFGGKIGPTSGQPIDATVTVTALKRDCLAELRPDPGAARRLRRDQGRRRRGGADHQPHPGAGPGAVPQSRHRADRSASWWW